MNLIESILQVTESQSYAETTNDEIVLTKFLALSKNQQELIDDFFVTLLSYKFTNLLGLYNKEKSNHITYKSASNGI